VSFIDKHTGRQQEVDFLNNLKEDLCVLENSWKKKKLHRKKVIKHFIGIVDSILEIAQSESFEPFEPICADVRDFLVSVASGKAELEQNFWSMTLELMDVLIDSLREGAVAFANLEEWQSRWWADASSEKSREQDPSGGFNPQDSPLEEVDDNVEAFGREENEMGETSQMDAKELLQKAQEALSSGNGDNAKELALKAAELIARLEADEAQKREKQLRADLETAAHVEAEAEETLKHLKEEFDEREQELAPMRNRLAEAQASFETQQRTCQELKAQIDETEAELESLEEKHKLLLDQLQEALPARDAAERERSKLGMEMERLGPEVETITDSVNAAESQLAKTREKREEIEAELEKLAEKIAT
jgi:DNA repair exonuclease SbcCD ATPase subunit